MKQILQSLRSGEIELLESPAPKTAAHQVLIQTRCSLLSNGTERMLLEFGKSGFLGKALQQPERVKQIVDKIRTDGLFATLDSVREKLDTPLALGYCNVGSVLERGEKAPGFAPGDRVVSNGFHSETVRVPHTLCARIPDGVSDETAAFAVLASIALESVRLAKPELGEKFAVLGLGLVGLMTVQLLRAAGCQVLAIDSRLDRALFAAKYGAKPAVVRNPEEAARLAGQWTSGRGVDGVVVATASDDSSPIKIAAELCRKRGRIILSGTAELKLDRSDFFEKELSFQVSCSYGPGRHDPAYENQGIDYPFAFVRWTAQRNFEAVLQLMKEGKLEVADLITHRFSIHEAQRAYETLLHFPVLGVLLEYPTKNTPSLTPVKSPDKAVQDATSRRPQDPQVVFIGPGSHANKTLLPALAKSGARLLTVVSSGGTDAALAARRFGFSESSSDSSRVLNSQSQANTVFIATDNASHAQLTSEALRNGQNVFVEKPLVLHRRDLETLEKLQGPQSPLLMVGFNRRFSVLSAQICSLLETRRAPKTLLLTVNAAWTPPKGKTGNEDAGKRILIEGCHFIDYLRFLAGHAIVDWSADRALGEQDDSRSEDISVRLRFADGSLGVLNYLSSGHRSLPKERLEIFSSGAVLQMGNFRSLRGFGWPGFRSRILWKQDKGHTACVDAFLEAVKNGKPSPIPWSEIKEVHEICLAIVDKLSR